VDPAQILGIDLGEVAVIRNIGGRVTAVTLQELALLRKLTQARGSDLDQGWNLKKVAQEMSGQTLRLARTRPLVQAMKSTATTQFAPAPKRAPAKTLGPVTKRPA
jgi:carbonic anhydrase